MKEARTVGIASQTFATLAGARCATACRCRNPGKDDPETTPPSEGMKRFEIRLSAAGGRASLEAGAIGTFTAAGPQEVCYYVDVIPGTSHEVVFASNADDPERGFSPKMKIAEYGPKGPWWYEVFALDCGGGVACTRQAADEWARGARRRKRGRLDPCGSAVITGLHWDTSGGLHARDGGFFRDLKLSFQLEVKKFATQFAPGSTQCIPK